MTKNDIDKAVQASQERNTWERIAAGSMVYCALIAGQSATEEILAISPPHVFTCRICKSVALACEGIIADGGTISLVSVREFIGKKGLDCTSIELAEVVKDASNSILTKSSAITAATNVRNQRVLDSAASIFRQGIDYSERPIGGISAALECAKEAQAILEETADAEDIGIDTAIREYHDELLSDRGQYRPTPTPWRSLNGILRGGMLPGELTVLAARPSVGKSAFALNLAYSVASVAPVLFISLEMSKQQLIDRLVANAADVDVGIFREGQTERYMDKISCALAEIRMKSLDLTDKTRITVAEIARLCRKTRKKYGGLGLVVVDYLQLVSIREKTGSREQDVAGISRGLKLLAKELKVPVLLLAQLNRKAEEGKREPMLSDLRESGAIEQDADIVVFLHQPRAASQWNPNEPIKVIVAKGRSSGVGSCHMEFKRKIQRIVESSEDAYTQAMKAACVDGGEL